MDPSIISALAALGGAAIGGLTSVVGAWLTQQTQVKAQELVQDKLRRQELYREFIEDASKTYGDALQHDKTDVSALVGIYTRISRMRVLSLPRTVACAEKIMQATVDTYFAPNKTIRDLNEMMKSGAGIDPLKDFSDAAREELGTLSL